MDYWDFGSINQIFSIDLLMTYVYIMYFYKDKHSSPFKSLLMNGKDYWEPRAVDECDYHTQKRYKGHKYIKILDLFGPLGTPILRSDAWSTLLIFQMQPPRCRIPPPTLLTVPRT